MTYVEFGSVLVTFTTTVSPWFASMVGPGNIPAGLLARSLAKHAKSRTIDDKHRSQYSIWGALRLRHGEVVEARLRGLADNAANNKVIRRCLLD